MQPYCYHFFLHRRMRFLHTPCKSGRCCERASSAIRSHQSGLSFKKFTWAPVSSTVKGKSISYPDRSKMLINCENNWRICFLKYFSILKYLQIYRKLVRVAQRVLVHTLHHPPFPNVVMLHNYGIFIKPEKLMSL